MSRHDATGDDFISIKEARAIFKSKGRAVTERTLQRYCEKHYLDGQKRVTSDGEKWFVLMSSVLTRITELDEFDKLRQPATSNDTSLVVANDLQSDLPNDNLRQVASEKMSEPVVSKAQSHSTAFDLSRHDATSRDTTNVRETSARNDMHAMNDRERELLEREIDQL